MIRDSGLLFWATLYTTAHRPCMQLPLPLCNWESWWVAYQQNPSSWIVPIGLYLTLDIFDRKGFGGGPGPLYPPLAASLPSVTSCQPSDDLSTNHSTVHGRQGLPGRRSESMKRTPSRLTSEQSTFNLFIYFLRYLAYIGYLEKIANLKKYLMTHLRPNNSWNFTTLAATIYCDYVILMPCNNNNNNNNNN